MKFVRGDCEMNFRGIETGRTKEMDEGKNRVEEDYWMRGKRQPEKRRNWKNDRSCVMAEG